MAFKRKQVDPKKLHAAIQYKWKGQVLEEGVVPLSKMTLRTLSDLFVGSRGVQQLQVMLAIIDYRNVHNPYPPTWEFLQFISGLDVETVRARVQELEDLGYVGAHPIRDRVDFEIEGFLEAVKKKTAEADKKSAAEQGQPTEVSSL